MNDNNLKSQKERTLKERQEIAKKGGLASGKKRREKKALKERLNILLSQEPLLDVCDIYNGVKDNTDLLAIKLFEQALKGNMGAVKVINELTGQETLTEYQEAVLDIKRQELELKKQELELKKIKGGLEQEISDKVIFVNVDSKNLEKQVNSIVKVNPNTKVIINDVEE